MADQDNLTRRDLIQLTAAAGIAGVTPAAFASKAAPKVFSKDEFAMVDELAELIIPSDEYSPGARAAQVAAYLDGRLAETIEDGPKRKWHEGLSRINTLSQEMHGRPFMQATHEQRVALLTRIAKNEEKPELPEEDFFRQLKGSTARAYYTSKIGIHQEMEYKGNVLLEEFVGYEVK
jgi:hypothetical protein